MPSELQIKTTCVEILNLIQQMFIDMIITNNSLSTSDQSYDAVI